ncbi:MAG: EAL domain-containing protein [Alphaproteobacteria bacterium]|nr:MAG: EAL domain-containing protein [Alphaproteobacteria bacterium]
MMSARKKQGQPPVKKGPQPKILIRPHTGKKQRPALSSVSSHKSLNDKVLQQPNPPHKNKKFIKKQRYKTRTSSVHLTNKKLFRDAALYTISAVLSVSVAAVVWYAAGVLPALILLTVLGIGGGVWAGYSKLLQDKERLRKDYERLRRGATEQPAPPAQQSLPESVAGLLEGRPETLSTDSVPQRSPQATEESFLEDVRMAAGTAYAATGTTAMAERLKPVEEDIDFSSLSAAADFSDWSDGKVIRCVQEAIARDRIDMFIQPIVQLPQRKRRFYEMYSRIRVRPDVYLPAERYIPLAKQDGILSEIDNRLLLHALELIQTADEGNLNRSFFCNISPFTLNDQQFMADLLEFLTQNRLLAPRLVFELTQGELTAIDPETLRVLDGLSRLGCRFAMDGVTHLDFDFEKMEACHIRYVKVSGGVLMRVLSGPGGFTQIRRMKDAFDYHAIDFIVEKIESERQLVEFLDVHADYGQGYLFGEPRKWTAEKSDRNIT